MDLYSTWMIRTLRYLLAAPRMNGTINVWKIRTSILQFFFPLERKVRFSSQKPAADLLRHILMIVGNLISATSTLWVTQPGYAIWLIFRI